jgi:hypothetical protein
MHPMCGVPDEVQEIPFACHRPFCSVAAAGCAPAQAQANLEPCLGQLKPIARLGSPPDGKPAGRWCAGSRAADVADVTRRRAASVCKCRRRPDAERHAACDAQHCVTCHPKDAAGHDRRGACEGGHNGIPNARRQSGRGLPVGAFRPVTGNVGRAHASFRGLMPARYWLTMINRTELVLFWVGSRNWALIPVMWERHGLFLC